MVTAAYELPIRISRRLFFLLLNTENKTAAPPTPILTCNPTHAIKNHYTPSIRIVFSNLFQLSREASQQMTECDLTLSERQQETGDKEWALAQAMKFLLSKLIPSSRFLSCRYA